MQDTALDFFFIIIITWNVTTLILHIYFNVRLVSDDLFIFFWYFIFFGLSHFIWVVIETYNRGVHSCSWRATVLQRTIAAIKHTWNS